MVPWVRFVCFVRCGATSSTHAPRGTGGWLNLPRWGLPPHKKRQASLGALTLGFSRCRKPQRGSWVRTRRSTLQPVSSSSPLRTGRAAFPASGAAPVVLLPGNPCSVRSHFSSSTVHAPWTARAVAGDLCSPLPKGEGPAPAVLILVDVAFPRADSYAPSAPSPRPWHCIRGLPLPPVHLPSYASGGFPCSAWKTNMARWRWRVALLAPSALCGSPVFGPWGGQVSQGHPGHRHGVHGSILAPLVSAFWLDWLTCQPRSVRVSLSRRAFPRFR